MTQIMKMQNFSEVNKLYSKKSRLKNKHVSLCSFIYVSLNHQIIGNVTHFPLESIVPSRRKSGCLVAENEKKNHLAKCHLLDCCSIPVMQSRPWLKFICFEVQALFSPDNTLHLLIKINLILQLIVITVFAPEIYV